MKAVPTFAALLQGFFTERLMKQRQASPHDRLVPRRVPPCCCSSSPNGCEAPATLALEDIDAPLIVAFLDELESVPGSTPGPAICG